MNAKNYKEKLLDIMSILNNEKIYCYSQYYPREGDMEILRPLESR